MKKPLLLLASLALIGAGCTSTTNLETTTQADVNADATAATSETTEIATDGSTTVKSGAIEATVEVMPKTETKTETKTEAKTETTTKTDEIPVVEIKLGNPDVKVTMETGNYFFNPKTITASAGQKVQILFTKNTGSHNFIIDKLGVNHTIKQGEGLTFTAPKEPGSYPFYCGIGSHRSMGMEGTLIVK